MYFSRKKTPPQGSFAEQGVLWHPIRGWADKQLDSGGKNRECGGGSLNIEIWDAVNYELSGMLQVGEDYGLDWSPDGGKLGFANTFIGIYTIDASLDNTNRNRLGTQEPRSSIAWNSDGTLIAAGGYSVYQNPTNVYIIDTITGDQLEVLPGHTGEISVVSWSPDDTQLVSVGQDQNLRIWDTATGELVTTIALNYSVVRDVVWSPDGSKIAYGGPDDTINIVSMAEILVPTATPTVLPTH